EYQVNDSGARIALAEHPEQAAKFLEIRDRCPNLEHLIQMEGPVEPDVARWEEVVASGNVGGAGDRFWKRARSANEEDLLTIIYTSGTTGEPKGVMLTHRNIVENVLASTPRIPVRRRDVALEFLPLCHVFERMVGYIYMWCSTYRAYCSIYHVGDLIADIRPHIFAAVPRFYEKVYEGIQAKLAEASPVRRSMFHWAVDIGREAAHRRIAGREIPLLLKKRHELADRLVLSKVREALGGRVRFAISGGAELPLHLGEFFHAVGIPVMEGYGLTETSPVIAVNGAKPGQLRLGTVGKPLKNLDIKIDDDGELLVRGPSVMKGYWNKPEMTAEVFDEEGYFRTGDLAEIDDDGFLLITGRKKDIIVTAGGKNVAPQPMETSLTRSPYVESAVVIGDGRPYLVAILSPAFDSLEAWARANGIEFAGREDLVTRPQVDRLYRDLIESVNAGRASFEQIKRFAVVPATFSVEDGQLTPTLKIKRRVIEQRYAQLIDRLYQ
ncbi:MAG TPA: long-chain fatty acid--CoA ligase, partial [Acidobacteria bacterium]|nr:long-chain fatty acid--CoA ligase [Acidobacteriota bacterium]